MEDNAKYFAMFFLMFLLSMMVFNRFVSRIPIVTEVVG